MIIQLKEKFFASLATLCLCLLLSSPAFASGSGYLEIITTKGPVKFQVEYAISPEEKAKGLMNRKNLANNAGMLFIYQTPKTVTMWMKNTLISLDMIFINHQGRIRSIEEKTQPQSTRQIHSGGKVSAVLELVGGSVENHGIQVGDEIRLLN